MTKAPSGHPYFLEVFSVGLWCMKVYARIATVFVAALGIRNRFSGRAQRSMLSGKHSFYYLVNQRCWVHVGRELPWICNPWNTFRADFLACCTSGMKTASTFSCIRRSQMLSKCCGSECSSILRTEQHSSWTTKLSFGLYKGWAETQTIPMHFPRQLGQLPDNISPCFVRYLRILCH